MKDPLRKMERALYVCALLLATMVLGLGFIHSPVQGKESYFVFYADFIFNESGSWAGYILAFLCLGGFSLSVAGWIRTTRSRGRRDRRALSFSIREKAGVWQRGIIDLLRVAFPIFLNLFLFSYVVGYINAVNRNRLIDLQLAALDHRITGSYLFLKLETISFPSWLIESVEFSFLNLPLFIVLVAIIAYLRSRLVFSKYAVAFFTSILLMIPLWLAVPVMSPQDRFIDNVYHLKDPPRMESALENFTPVPGVEEFLKQMRRAKGDLDVMPTTTFPSSHAAWATIALIYLLEVSSAAGIFFAPFLLLSTIGTFYLAQHYFVDTPAGIIIGVVSVLITSYIFRERPGDNGLRSFK